MNDEQVAKVQQQREQMKEELVNLQQRISEQINTISNLEHAHDKVSQEMEQMTLLLAARETDIVNLKSKKEEGLQHIQQQLSKELAETKLVNDKLQEQLKELNREKAFANKAVQTVTISGGTLEDLQKRFEQLQLEHTASETNLQCQEETIVTLREQVEQLTEILQLSESKECENCSHLMKQVEDVQLKCEPLEGRIVAMEKENKELTDEIKKLQDDQFTATEVVTSEKNQLELELSKCSKELERLKTHLLQVTSCVLAIGVYLIFILGGTREQSRNHCISRKGK